MAFNGKVEITVRDGRAGRAVDSDGKGVVLAKFDKDFPPYDEGDLLALSDGTPVVVIGSEEKIMPEEYYRQTIFVGSPPN